MSKSTATEIKTDVLNERLGIQLQKLGANSKSEMTVFEVSADGEVTETIKTTSVTDLMDKVRNNIGKTAKSEIQLIYAVANLCRNLGFKLSSKELDSLTGLNNTASYIYASCLPPRIIEKLGGMSICRTLVDEAMVSALHSSKCRKEQTTLLSSILNYVVRLKPNGSLGTSFELELVNIGLPNAEKSASNKPMLLSANTDISQVKVFEKTRKIMRKSGLETSDKVDREDEGFRKGKRDWLRLISICTEIRTRLETELELFWYEIKGRETKQLWFHKGEKTEPDKDNSEFETRNKRKALYSEVKKLWNKNSDLIVSVRDQLDPENKETVEEKEVEVSALDALEHAAKLAGNIAEKDAIIRKLCSKIQDIKDVGLSTEELEMVQDLMNYVPEPELTKPSVENVS